MWEWEWYLKDPDIADQKGKDKEKKRGELKEVRAWQKKSETKEDMKPSDNANYAEDHGRQ